MSKSVCRLFPVLALLFIGAVNIASADTPKRRIINGAPVSGADYPWMASVEMRDWFGSGWGNFCGGALISPEFVITAAHCVSVFSSPLRDAVMPSQPEGLRVSVGRTHVMSTEGVAADAAEVFIHPDYSSYTNRHDVALLRLTAPVELTPIGIAADPELWKAGTPAAILGWGMIDPTFSVYPNQLRKGDVPLIADAVCAQEYETEFDASTMICAGVLSSGPGQADGVDTCYGDSGGPLFVHDAQGHPQLVGLTSFGMECASSRFHGVYGRVSAARDWLAQVLDPSAEAPAVVNGMWPLIREAVSRIPRPGPDAGDYDALLHDNLIFHKLLAARQASVGADELIYLASVHGSEIRARYPHFTGKSVKRAAALIKRALKSSAAARQLRREIKHTLKALIG